ncbi:unnamed protein product, partial [Nesidiocoris tenuis]
MTTFEGPDGFLRWKRYRPPFRRNIKRISAAELSAQAAGGALAAPLVCRPHSGAIAFPHCSIDDAPTSRRRISQPPVAVSIVYIPALTIDSEARRSFPTGSDRPYSETILCIGAVRCAENAAWF